MARAFSLWETWFRKGNIMEASRRIELLYTDLQSARFWLFLKDFLCTRRREHTRNISRMWGRITSRCQRRRSTSIWVISPQYPTAEKFSSNQSRITTSTIRSPCYGYKALWKWNIGRTQTPFVSHIRSIHQAIGARNQPHGYVNKNSTCCERHLSY